MKKNLMFVFIFGILLFSLFSLSFSSAGWWSDFWGKITGKAVASDYSTCTNCLNAGYKWCTKTDLGYEMGLPNNCIDANQAGTGLCEEIGGSVVNTLTSCPGYVAPVPAKINGVCGSANGKDYSTAPTSNLCSAGTDTPLAFSQSSQSWFWSCKGINGGTIATCSASYIEPNYVESVRTKNCGPAYIYNLINITGHPYLLYVVAIIGNSYSAYTSDSVQIREYGPGTNYRAILTSKGKGWINIQGKIYNITYSVSDNSNENSLTIIVPENYKCEITSLTPPNPAPTPTTNVTNRTTQTCTDSDGGKNYDLKGIVSNFSVRPQQIYETGLNSSDGLVVLSINTATLRINNEQKTVVKGNYYDYLFSKIYISDIYFSSLSSSLNYVKFSVVSLKDFCNSGELTEYYCSSNNSSNNYSGEESYECPNGCSGGACANVTNQTISTALTPLARPSREIPATEELTQSELEQQITTTASSSECGGCFEAGKCYPVMYRLSGKYCSVDGVFTAQLAGNSICDNSFQCEGNVCAGGKCLEAGFIQKIISWFANLFG